MAIEGKMSEKDASQRVGKATVPIEREMSEKDAKKREA
jgi:hypothetical protein